MIVKGLLSLAVGILFFFAEARAQTGFNWGNPSSPQLFGEGVISTADDEINGGFSPDGQNYYFAKLIQYTTFPRVGLLCVSHFHAGRWSSPEVLPFSGAQVYDTQPRPSPDGEKLFFTSSRPAPGKQTRPFRIWVAQKKGESWSEAEPLPEPINMDNSWNWGPSVTQDGTLYFTSDREQRFHPQIYRSRLIDGIYQKPEKLGPEINSEFNDSDAFVSADESILVFASSGSGAPDNKNRAETIDGHGFQYPRGDLYISFRRNGLWTTARHLEHGINTEFDEGSPSITSDGKYLFFSSDRSPFTVPTAHRMTYREITRDLHSTLNGHGNIFYISLDAIGEQR